MTQIEFGNIIKYHRKTNKLTQRQLSKIVGCSYATMSKVECGKQAAKVKLVLSILKTVIPELKDKLLLIEAEAEFYEMSKSV